MKCSSYLVLKDLSQHIKSVYYYWFVPQQHETQKPRIKVHENCNISDYNCNGMVLLDM